MDLVVLNVDKAKRGLKKLHELARQLKRRNLANDVQVIPARVPIVKFTDAIVGFKVDISINADTGVKSAEYVKEIVRHHEGLR